ncbi:tyrosine-type recombinase/integrase [Corynebacterium marquesiae]|uniref:tyrosine-type recombinase/integrase n=1 Tax=Corynebacterium marquesiae TaxID=2913503 RepID=UPI0032EF368C
MAKEYLGAARQLASGRFQARYTYKGINCKAPNTFPTRAMATAWLVDETDLVNADKRGKGKWLPPHEREALEKAAQVTLDDWFKQDYMQRVDIRHSTKKQQESLFNSTISPFLGSKSIGEVDPVDVRMWARTVRLRLTEDRAACGYKLLNQLFNRAVAAGYIRANPCQFPELGRRPKSKAKPLLTAQQLAVVLHEIGEWNHLPVMLAASCALRVGEWTELRLKDIEFIRDSNGQIAGGRIYISRGVSRDKGAVEVGEPKTAEGTRVVHVPQWLVPSLAEHVKSRGSDPDALLFVRESGLPVTRQSFNKLLTRAGNVAQYRANLTTHQLRHFGATEFLRAGGNVRDLQARLGHSTPTQAIHYAHATEQRDLEIANNMPVFMLAEEKK